VLWQRVLTALVGIPLLLVLIYLGGWYFAVAVALIAVAGLRELYRLLERRFLSVWPWVGYPLATLAVVGAAAGGNLIARTIAPLVEGAVLLAAFALSARWLLTDWPRLASTRLDWLEAAKLMSARRTFPELLRSYRAGDRVYGFRYPKHEGLSATLSSHVCVPQLLTYLIRLRNVSLPSIAPRGTDALLPAGALLVMLLMAVVWGMDTAAYAVGKTWGRHKLCPAISPGKTVEGAIAGFLAAAGLCVATGYWFGLPVVHGLILGSAIGILGQAGDLFESLLKRRAGVKDSGIIIPGHGGVLDRFDSLLFSAPVAFYYLATLEGYFPI